MADRLRCGGLWHHHQRQCPAYLALYCNNCSRHSCGMVYPPAGPPDERHSDLLLFSEHFLPYNTKNHSSYTGRRTEYCHSETNCQKKEVLYWPCNPLRHITAGLLLDDCHFSAMVKCRSQKKSGRVCGTQPDCGSFIFCGVFDFFSGPGNEHTNENQTGENTNDCRHRSKIITNHRENK